MALPERDEEYLRDKQYDWTLRSAPSEQLLVLQGYQLPEGKYQPEIVDLLIRIPAGYPQTHPDMFFIRQAVTLASGSLPLNVAMTTVNGENWHQWSRHYQSAMWRSGIDGLATYLRAVRTELEKGR